MQWLELLLSLGWAAGNEPADSACEARLGSVYNIILLFLKNTAKTLVYCIIGVNPCLMLDIR